MPLAKKLIKFLSKIKYEPISHRTVYTAFDKAKTLRVPEKIVGKTLVIKMDGDFALVLIPANKILDIKKFLKTANSWQKHGAGISRGQRPSERFSHAGFASEVWMKKNMKGVKIGAIPPFGNLWPLARRGQRPGGGLPTFAEKSLLNQSKIIINGGDYNSSIKISSVSFKKLIPDLVIGSFAKVRE
jgi:Ala-tRNA(Pro) deacylase